MTSILPVEKEIELDGLTRVLSATPNAALRISRHFGGFKAARDRLLAEDLDAYVAIIRFGCGLKDGDAKGLEDKVFAAGLTSLFVPLLEYIGVLISGGKPSSSEEDREPKKAEL